MLAVGPPVQVTRPWPISQVHTAGAASWSVLQHFPRRRVLNRTFSRARGVRNNGGVDKPLINPLLDARRSATRQHAQHDC